MVEIKLIFFLFFLNSSLLQIQRSWEGGLFFLLSFLPLSCENQKERKKKGDASYNYNQVHNKTKLQTCNLRLDEFSQ